MKVRVFAADDLASVYAIQLKCPQAAQWRQEEYLHLASDPGGRILVAEHEGPDLPEVAGFAVFRWGMEEAELHNLAISPSYQRRGIARALLAAGIRTMQEFGARQIFLEVRASNQPALAFYRAAGFHLLYARYDYYQDPAEDALVLACDITPSPELPSDQERA